MLLVHSYLDVFQKLLRSYIPFAIKFFLMIKMMPKKFKKTILPDTANDDLLLFFLLIVG